VRWRFLHKIGVYVGVHYFLITTVTRICV